MGFIASVSTLKARKQASDATRDTIFKILQNYLDEVKSYGDELDVDTFYDQFNEYYRKNWLNP